MPLWKRLALFTLVTVLAACSGTTGGALVTLPFSAGGAQVPSTFTSATGWTVALDQALIALGPFYFNISPPTTDTFRTGIVIVQATEQVVVDVLNPTLYPVTGGADGETGAAVAVEIDLFAPDQTQTAPIHELLGNDVGFVAGSATKASTTVQFAGPVAINPNQATAQQPLPWFQRVNGAAADLVFSASPQALELRVDPTHWFDSVDFSQLLRGSAANGVYTWNVSACTTSSQTPAQVGQCAFLTALEQGVRADSGVYFFQLAAY